MAGGTAALTGGVALLERAISYTLGGLRLVDAEALTWPTPCRAWDLRALLAHLDDSLVALTEAVEAGRVGGVPWSSSVDGRRAASLVDPVVSVRERASRLLGAWTGALDLTGDGPGVAVGAGTVNAGVVSGAGAIEIAVHGWDITRACRRRHPIPGPLAGELLDLAHVLVTAADRPRLFAAPVRVPVTAGPAERLVAFLGRDPAAGPR